MPERSAAGGLPPAARQAIDWRLRLDSGQAGPREHAALAAWLDEHPAHREAWQRVNGLFAGSIDEILQLGRSRPGLRSASAQALSVPGRSRRRLAGGSVAALALGGVALWTLDRHTPLATLLAEHRTDTAERRSTRLADGSMLTLDARSAAGAHFDAAQRVLRLQSGAMALQVARDPRSRPFLVHTPWAVILAAEGARLVVSHGSRCDQAAVLEGSVRIASGDGRSLPLRAGGSARVDERGIEALRDDASVQSAWLDGMLDARDESLGEVVEALRRYRRGVIRVSSAAARLRVFAMLRLDDPGRALRSLAQILPITVREIGPWLTLVEALDGGAR